MVECDNTPVDNNSLIIEEFHCGRVHMQYFKVFVPKFHTNFFIFFFYISDELIHTGGIIESPPIDLMTIKNGMDDMQKEISIMKNDISSILSGMNMLIKQTTNRTLPVNDMSMYYTTCKSVDELMQLDAQLECKTAFQKHVSNCAFRN